MSRPPRPHIAESTVTPLPSALPVLDYLPSEFADFVERQRLLVLATESMRLLSANEEGDFANTLMELSAVAAHVLAVYQRRFASEAFLGTAQSPRSLVRHGRRLGYEADPGLAATGYAVIIAKPDMKGLITAGLELSSVPRGEQVAQEYETLEDVSIDAAHNELELVRVAADGGEAPPGSSFAILETGLDLSPNDMFVLQGKAQLHAGRIVDVEERGGLTILTHHLTLTGEGPWTVYAAPRHVAANFGNDADRLVFTQKRLQTAQAFPAALPADDSEVCGYITSGAYDERDIYLDRLILDKLTDQPAVLAKESGSLLPFWVKSQKTLSVAIDVSAVDVTATPAQRRTTRHSGTVSALQVQRMDGTIASPVLRPTQPAWDSVWHVDFRVRAPVARNTRVGASLKLSALDGFVPGQLLVLATRPELEPRVAEIAVITRVNPEDASLTYRVISPPDRPHQWVEDELIIHGNVVRISHGKRVEEVLGQSDGISAFQRFALKSGPLTWLPSPDGGEPALEVRVHGVRWQRVRDFEQSDGDDTHYLLQRDDQGVVSIVFGDGRRGAVPAAGEQNIFARYRVGLGPDGNVAAGDIRLSRAHALIERVDAPLPVEGGTPPADAAQLRSHAVRYLRTFDRALSVQDHADLALLCNGVARAAAYWSGSEVKVIVADARGQAPGSLQQIDAFLRTRRDNEIPMSVEAPKPLPLSMEIHFEHDAASYERAAVERMIRAALIGTQADAPGLFTFAGRKLGAPAFASEVYALLEAIAGVRYVELRGFRPKGESGVATQITAEPNSWLSLSAEDLVFSEDLL